MGRKISHCLKQPWQNLFKVTLPSDLLTSFVLIKTGTESLPKEFTCAKEAKDLITDCCKGIISLNWGAVLIRGTEFVLALSSEANEICDKESKKTLLPEHILAALKVSLPPSTTTRM